MKPARRGGRLMSDAPASRAMTSGMFSSATGEWETPQALFDLLNEEFCFDTDVCATPQNAKCSHYYTKVEDGLSQHWSGRCWMNPPYGRQIGAWVRKAHEAAGGGGDRGLFGPRSHRHALVAGSLHAGVRDTIYRRPCQIRGFEQLRTVSVGSCYFRDTEGSGHFEDGDLNGK